MESMKQATETFSKFRALQREAKNQQNLDNEQARLFVVHGDDGRMTEVAFGAEPGVVMAKFATRLGNASPALEQVIREARGVILEHGTALHHPRPDIEHHLEPEQLETEADLEANYVTAFAILTIGADLHGSSVRIAPLPGQNLPAEVEPPCLEIEDITSESPFSKIAHTLETCALAIDTARKIIERDGRLPSSEEIERRIIEEGDDD
jgi:hypothetical protein